LSSYDPSLNSINFPAGIIQTPFFTQFAPVSFDATASINVHRRSRSLPRSLTPFSFVWRLRVPRRLGILVHCQYCFCGALSLVAVLEAMEELLVASSSRLLSGCATDFVCQGLGDWP
jgi:hypothetical protein